MGDLVCPKCGTPNPEAKRFCENCGHPFAETAAQITAPQAGTVARAEAGATDNATPGNAATVNGNTMQGNIPVNPAMQQGNIPVNPAMPSQGNIPVNPAIPSQGNIPANPAMPSQGNIPANPAMPSQGNIPANPAMPSKKNIPVNPAMPSQGNIPVNPAIPSQGNIPANPAMPPQGRPVMYSPVEQPPKSGKGAIAAVIILLLLLLGGGGVAAYLLLSGETELMEIEVSETSLKLEVGERAELDITNYDDLGEVTLAYISEDEDVVRITKEYDDGFDIKAVGEGRTRILIQGKNMEDLEISVKVTDPETETSSNTSQENTTAHSDPDTDHGSTPEPEPETPSSHTEPEPDPTDPPETDGTSSEMPDSLDLNSDGAYNLWSYASESIVGSIYVVDGYTVDDVYSGPSTVFCDSDSMAGIYYSCYAEMPYPEWAWLEFGETPEGSTSFSMESHDLGLTCNGSKIYYASRYDDTNEFQEYEMYYIYYSYYCSSGGYTDYVTIELYPEQAANWTKEDYQEFARAVFGL